MVLYDDLIKKTNSLSDCLARASEDGFTERFKVVGNRLTTDNEKFFYEAEDLNIEDSCKFVEHGVSAEEAIVYMIEAKDGRRGTLIHADGDYAGNSIDALVRKIEELMRHNMAHGPRTWKDFLKGF